MSNRVKGLMFGVAGIVILSPDSMLIRINDAPETTVIFGRAIAVAIGAAIVLAIQAGRGSSPWSRDRWLGVAYGVLYAIGLIGFPLSVQQTNVANTLVIISATPLACAIGARLVLKEQIATHTWMAAAGVFGCVLWIISADFGGERLAGNLYAVLAIFAIVCVTLIVRRRPSFDVLPGIMIGGVVGAVVCLPFISGPVSAEAAMIMAVNGGVINFVPFLLIAAASRLLPPPEVGLLFLLETILGPLWVWLAVGEVPSEIAVKAGAVIIVLLMLHYGFDVARRRRG